MKTKIVYLAMALALVLGAVPVVALPATLAGASPAVIEVWDNPDLFTAGDGTAAWATSPRYSGLWSARLGVLSPGTSSAARVKVDLDTPIEFDTMDGSDPDEANFRGRVQSGGSGLGAQLYMSIYCDLDDDSEADYRLVANGAVSKADGSAPESHVGDWEQYQPTDFGGITYLLSADAHGQQGWVYNDNWAGYIANGFGNDTVIAVAVSMMNTYTAAVVYVDSITINGQTHDLEAPIQSGINAAESGDTVIVYPGKYEESLYINDMTLTLRSSSTDWRDVDLDPNGSNGITISGLGHVTVQGFEIRDFPQDGIHITNIRHGGSVTILDCFIHDNSGAGIFGGNLNGLLTIDGNIIADNGSGDKTGVALMNVGGPAVGATVVITDNVIGAWYDTEEEEYYSGNSGDGIRIENIWPTSTVTIGGLDEGEGNDIGNNTGEGIGVEYVDGNLNILGNNGSIHGNNGDGIDIYSTRPESSVVIQGNDISDSVYAEGINISYVNGSVTIGGDPEEGEGNIISGNGGDGGIVIEDVDGTVVIDGNRIADNGGNGIDIDEIETDEWDGIPLVGSVTISNNYVGEWTDDTQTYGGNDDDGIDIGGVESGCTLTIGPNNNIVDNGYYGIDLGYVDDGTDVTIFDNTIARNGTGYVGIGLYDCEDVTIDGNTITGHQIGIDLSGSSSYNAVINNVISDNMGDEGEYGIGIKIGRNSHHNGIVGNLIADNGDGIWVRGDQNDILYNVITGNVAEALPEPQCGVHIEGFGENGAEDNVVNYNNIFGNSDPDIGSYGVFHHQPAGPDAEILDARWNWWGDASGPYHGGTNPNTEGDSVSSFVDYSEWATSPFPYSYTGNSWEILEDFDTAAPDILTTVAMPDMVSLYTAIEGWTEEWLPSFMEYEEEFGFTPGPGESALLVETTDIPGEGAAPRGIRYVTLDLKGALAQLMGVPDVWDVQPPEWVKPWDQEEWLSRWHRYLKTVNRWEEMEFYKDCTRPVWHQDVFFRYTLSSLYWMYFDWHAGYSKLFEMIEPGEFHIEVTVEDWAGNPASGYIEVSLVDVAIPLEQGWNLRSTPIALDANCWGDITELGDGLEYAIAYRYDSVSQKWQQLTDVSVLSPLEGVAIKATSRDALGLVFDRWATAPPVRPVSEGLNLIGLAAGPPDDPWMPADDALISIEEIRDGLRGYIVVESPQQYLQYHEQWHWCGEVPVADAYHWYFGQQSWTYLHPGDEAVPPVPDMTIGGAYWVYMERDDTLVGFGSTPLFLKLLVERGQDLLDVPRFPATTMVFYMDWMDEWAQGFVPESYHGLQWQKMVYKGSFSPEDVLTYYETVLPGYGWQMGLKFNVDLDVEFCSLYIGEAIGIGFWKEADHGGIPYYTDTVRILAWEMDGISFVAVCYLPVDIPTLPGTNLVLWQSAWPCGDLEMQYEGSAMPEDVVNDLMEAMSKLQWSFYDPIYTGNMPYDMYADFYKYWLDPDDGLVQLYADVDIEFPQHQGWGVEQPVIIDIERGVYD